MDDILDFTSSSKVMGKPALNDLKSGLATAPVLFAAEEYPELTPLIQRRFQNDGDVNLAQKLVFQSRGIERTRELAAEHASLAAEKVRSVGFQNSRKYADNLMLRAQTNQNLLNLSSCPNFCRTRVICSSLLLRQ